MQRQPRQRIARSPCPSLRATDRHTREHAECLQTESGSFEGHAGSMRSSVGPIFGQTQSFRGSKSRNKVSAKHS
ncbi:hypothetical protein KCU96_g61, partial [Aureobasidium melanogenum]